MKLPRFNDSAADMAASCTSIQLTCAAMWRRQSDYAALVNNTRHILWHTLRHFLRHILQHILWYILRQILHHILQGIM